MFASFLAKTPLSKFKTLKGKSRETDRFLKPVGFTFSAYLSWRVTKQSRSLYQTLYIVRIVCSPYGTIIIGAYIFFYRHLTSTRYTLMEIKFGRNELMHTFFKHLIFCKRYSIRSYMSVEKKKIHHKFVP